MTPEQLRAYQSKELAIFGEGGDVRRELNRLREESDQEIYRRLLPGYVRQYIEKAAPLVDIDLQGDTNRYFSFAAKRRGSLDALLPLLEVHTPEEREKLTVYRPSDDDGGVWLHPGESLFERFRAIAASRLSPAARRGADLQRGIASGLIQLEISVRNARVAILQELVDGARRLIQARGREMAAEVPGGETGLLVRDYKGKDASAVVYKADCALMGRIEAHLREASVQLGQRVAQTETSTFDAVEMVKMLHEGRARARENYEARMLACSQSAETRRHRAREREISIAGFISPDWRKMTTFANAL